MHRRHWPLAALAIVLALAALAYAPGLSGGFLFDDFVNLDALGATGKVDDWPTFWRYVTSGTADPLGRPLSLLSFLLDARDWPADPFPFLRTNLALHLLNGGLLFVLLRRLERGLGSDDTQSGWVAAMASAAWLLHPLFVSTTLYIVQREAMLPATFTLLGLIAWFHGRALAGAGRPRAAFAWMLAGIGGGTALAMLCKANGVLLPLLAWVLDAAIPYRSQPDESASRNMSRLRVVLLVLPTLLLGAWMLSKLHDLGAVVGGRDWSLGQRLLTEPRVLVEYFWLLLAPRAISAGLYNDAYVPSTGLLHPWQTLPCVLLLASLLVLAIAVRRRSPRLSAALLFFFGAQVLESSVIPLELYFEHRNYLPAMLLAWPITSACLQDGPRQRVRVLAYSCWLLLLAGVLFQRATLWGNQDALYSAWARAVPTSPRALATDAMTQARRGNVEGARVALDQHWRRNPNELQLGLNYVDMACRVRGLDAADAGRVETMLRSATHGESLLLPWLGKAIALAGQGGCTGLSLPVVERWIDATASNPRLVPAARAAALVEPLRGQAAVARGDADAALRHFNIALASQAEPAVAAGQAAVLASAGFYDAALAHLDRYDALPHPVPSARGMGALHERVLARQGYWSNELSDLRRRLDAARREQAAP